MKRFIWFAVITLGLCLCGLGLNAAVASPQDEVVAALAIPAGLTGFPGDTLVAPVFITTTTPLIAAQFLVEFDNKDFKFLDAVIGPDAGGFAVQAVAPQPPVRVITAGATENMLLELSRQETQFLFGSDLNVLFLRFKVVGVPGGASPFFFNPAAASTFLTTENLATLSGEALQINHGSGTITNIATLSIPGGFSVAKAETLAVPVRLSSAKPLGLAQIALEYDGNDIKFLDAQTGADAAGFSVLVETAPGFSPTAAGTNKNVVITLYSGGATLAGSDKIVAVLLFQATGGVGGNSPLAFDRRSQHTVLSTADLTDLTGTDLAFRNGDATILPPLVKLSGSIFYRNTTAPVAGAVITVSGATAAAAAATNANGIYLSRRASQSTYTLRAAKTGDRRDGIQGSDALLILRAAAFIDTLKDDQRFTADVTRDNRITVSDALAVLRFLAGQATGTAHVGEWIFQPEFYTLFVQSDTARNFKTFLLGDVNGNWAPVGGLQKAAALPFATIKFAEWREDGDNVHLALRAGKESFVFTALASLALPANLGQEMRFVPSRSDILAVTNYDAQQNWRLALANIAGVAPEEKIGELVMSRTAAAGLQNRSFKTAEVNDWPQKTTGVETRDESKTLPTEYVLSQNYPNPFNPTTWITFGIPARAGEVEVRLEIFTIDGRLVRSLVQNKLSPGAHRVQWDGRDGDGASVPTGVYFYRIRAGNFAASRKLALVK